LPSASCRPWQVDPPQVATPIEVPLATSVAASTEAVLAIVETNNAIPRNDEQNRLAANTDQPGTHEIFFFVCIVAHSGFETGPHIQHDATPAVYYKDQLTYLSSAVQCNQK
jgi:hypothetical protein